MVAQLGEGGGPVAVKHLVARVQLDGTAKKAECENSEPGVIRPKGLGALRGVFFGGFLVIFVLHELISLQF